MIVYVNTSGTAIAVQPSPVYQGSSLSGALYFVAPFPTTNAVSVAFTLPNGDITSAYPMTSVAALPGVMDALGDEYSVWEYQPDNALITAHAGTVTAQFRVTYNGANITTSAINFTVQEGVFPVPPADPSVDEWQTLINLYGNLSGRVTALEDRQTAKVLVDFTVDDKTGKGVKYYSDGSTAMVQFPTGSGSPSVASGLVNILTFTTDSWVSADGGGYELAFGSEATGFKTSDFVALLSSSGSATYEAGTETTASERSGFFTQSDSVFQGSDGSILLTANVPYAGRVAAIGGEIVIGQTVVDASYSLTAHVLTLHFANGGSMQIQFESKVSQFDNDANYQTAAEVQAAVSSEESARKNADGQLQSQITQNSGDISTLESGLAAANTAIDGLRNDVNSKEHFRGYYATTAQVQAITTPSAGDFAYNAQTGTKWVYNASASAWSDTGEAVPDQVTPKSATTPLMDGTASAGAENAYAAGDHRHPTDTSRAAASTVTSHINNKNNPHEVTPAQIGAQPAGNYVTTDSGQNITAKKTLSQVGLAFQIYGDTVVLEPVQQYEYTETTYARIPHKTGTLAMLDDIPTVTTGAYTASISSSNWTGSAAPYTYTITAATHGKGNNPTASVYDASGNKVSVGINVSAAGTVTLSSTVKFGGKIVII